MGDEPWSRLDCEASSLAPTGSLRMHWMMRHTRGTSVPPRQGGPRAGANVREGPWRLAKRIPAAGGKVIDRIALRAVIFERRIR